MSTEELTTEEQSIVKEQVKAKMKEHAESKPQDLKDAEKRVTEHQTRDFVKAFEKLQTSRDMSAVVDELIELKNEYKALKAKPFTTSFDYNIKRNIQDRVRDCLDELPRDFQSMAKDMLPSAITPYYRGRI